MKNNDLIIINEETIKDKIYEIRGQKVMLDFELSELYGYETRDFNNQVKNNIDRFPEDFRFQLNSDEFKSILRLKKSTANSSISKRRSFPYAFTEQGIYMLMTVLKGELAVKQSKALIRLFKSMKDYIVETNNLITSNELLRLSRQVNENTKDIKEIETRLNEVMDSFVDPRKRKQLIILDGERIEADLAYEQIYSSAKESIYIIDDFVSIKTLHHLKVCSKTTKITIITDNLSKNRITNEDINDFMCDSGMDIKIIPSNGRFHDRFIVIDYQTDNEQIYISGASSKDAGNKITTIIKIEEKEAFHPLFDKTLLTN